VRKLSILLTACCILAVAVTSCKKSSKGTSAPPITDTLTQDIYTIDSTASPSKGIILAAPYPDIVNALSPTPGILLVMDQSGKVLMEKTTPGTAFDLNRWIVNGKTRYTYLVDDPGAFREPGGIENAGYAIIADSNLNTLQQVNFTPYAAGIFPPNQGLDVHDFILIADSDYITLSYFWKHVTNIPARLNPVPNVSVITPIIEEVRNGSVVFHWDGSADTSFYANSVEGNNFSDTTAGAQDYMHMNSLFIDPRDNNLICSMRNQNQVIKINRQTGAVVWRLGGSNSDFKLDATETFLRQHHATLTDDNQTLLMFDNGEQTQRPYSRVCEFQLNEASKTITGFKFFNIPEPFTLFTGSVQKIGADYFIDGGTAQYILDVNYNTGQKVIEFLGTGMDMDNYRAFKY
jgi:arylsulfate sulfotransferase